jgi:polyphosphate kinase 2 (PPK2 family)
MVVPVLSQGWPARKMTIHSKDFRVREAEAIDLREWPTKVKPVYESKKRYREMLGEHVQRLGSLQQLLYASNSHAVLLIFQAMDAAGEDQPPGLSGLQLQAPQPRRAATRLSLAHHA